MKASMPKRFLTLRDKDGSHRRSKSAEGSHRTRPLSSEVFFSIFKTDSSKQAAKEEGEKVKDAAKVDDIAKRLADQHFNNVSNEYIKYALATKFASGDADKAFDLLKMQQQAFSGIITPYNPKVHMVGAENRGNVTCYLDSLLFAMFAKLDAFDCMLTNDLSEEPQRKLAGLIRLWVNMLRGGKLIHTDMMEHLQNALADCGWKDARELEQQDTSEAFAFITETLQLPLLTLQVDLFHQGKGDADDHKVVYERLLNLAVPPDPSGKGIKLEDCLEDYFNARVDVLRDSPEEKKGSVDLSSQGRSSTIRIVTEGDDQPGPANETGVVQRRWTLQNPEDTQASPTALERPEPRNRSASIIQRIVVDDQKQSTDSDIVSLVQRAKRTGSTVVKAVTIPAWQFFKLIPWHNSADNQPSNDLEVARQLSQRPVVGICLKRYMWTESGIPKRHNTFIDIPDSMRLPHFMFVDDKKQAETRGLNTEYKLVLQSVVCHRGDSLHSGHYISFARVAPKLLTDNRRHDFDPPPDYEEAQWVKFDDLHLESRISYVDDIKQALKEEMPYLLFYQIVPVVDVAAASSEGSATEPPSYADSTTMVVAPPTPSLEAEYSGMSRSTSGYFDNKTTGSGGGPSIRLSGEEPDRPSRLSLEEDAAFSLSSARHPHAPSSTAGTDNAYSRRGSLVFSDSIGGTPAITPEGGVSPVIPHQAQQQPHQQQAPSQPGVEDSSTAQRLSRAAARFTTRVGSRSRPPSQAGDGRISSTMTKLGLVRSNRDPSKDDLAGHGTEVADVVAEEPVVIVDEQHNHVHIHHSKKDRSKVRRSGGVAEKDKEKGKEKDKEKEDKTKNKAELPDRECVVM